MLVVEFIVIVSFAYTPAPQVTLVPGLRFGEQETAAPTGAPGQVMLIVVPPVFRLQIRMKRTGFAVDGDGVGVGPGPGLTEKPLGPWTSRLAMGAVVPIPTFPPAK
jgi:hypothetical protein